MKIVVVGAGLSGCSIAYLLKKKGHSVEIFECNPFFGGLCSDSVSHDGIKIHRYGGHILHTERKEVWDFVRQFTDMYEYKHSVMAVTEIGSLYLPARASNFTIWENDEKLRRIIINYVMKPYSYKQWEKDFNNLPDMIKNRVPLISDDSGNNFFFDKYQGIPADGYSNMFERMISKIPCHLGVDKNEWKGQKADLYIYTGSIDEMFRCVRGPLYYRSLNIEYNYKKVRLLCGAINSCLYHEKHIRKIDHAYFSSSTAKKKDGTVISTEYSDKYNYKKPTLYTTSFVDEGIINWNMRFYPFQDRENLLLYSEYKKMIPQNVILLGRLAMYDYINMDEAIKRAIDLSEKI